MKMAKYIVLLVFLFLGASNLSCTDEGKIAVAFEEDREFEEGDTVPFLLRQNFPNPFNGTTYIRFRVATSLHVKLQIFTEDWLLVDTPIDTSFSVGVYEFTLDFDKEQPSGEYYYVMEAANVTQVRKMLYIK